MHDSGSRQPDSVKRLGLLDIPHHSNRGCANVAANGAHTRNARCALILLSQTALSATFPSPVHVSGRIILEVTLARSAAQCSEALLCRTTRPAALPLGAYCHPPELLFRCDWWRRFLLAHCYAHQNVHGSAVAAIVECSNVNGTVAIQVIRPNDTKSSLTVVVEQQCQCCILRCHR